MSIAKAIVALATVVVIVLGSEDESQIDVTSSENGITDKSNCASEFIEWCRNSVSAMNGGVSVLVRDNNDQGQRTTIVCLRDPNRINCTKNDSPWFVCNKDGNLQYKGQQLVPGYEDDDICTTKDSAKRLFHPPRPFDRTAFENGMKNFHEMMKDFENRMKRRLGTKLPFPNHREVEHIP